MSSAHKSVLPAELLVQVREILIRARKSAYLSVNSAMVQAYWNIGKAIVEDEQKGKKRARYGTHLIRALSERLAHEFGKGFDATNLKQMRQFYLRFRDGGAGTGDIHAPVSNSGALRHLSENKLRPELSWTHYRLLIRVEDYQARMFYMHEAASQNWSTRQLERNISSLYYQRMLSNRHPDTGQKERGKDQSTRTAEDYIKDPYVFEFLQLDYPEKFHEADLETALLDKMQEFLLELGTGFAFVSRQKRISTETKDFYIDLVFYNYHLKCFILVDLKVGGLTHQDIGQMDMYDRIFEDRVKPAEDNPTIGIILCSEKDETIVRYSVLKENRQLFASKYKLYLPSEAELCREVKSRISHIRTSFDRPT